MITDTHGTIVNIYIVYELKCLFGGFKFTKNADIGKYKYYRYGTGFDGHGTFSFPNGEYGCNVIIFEVDMSSSVHVDNKKKDVLILSEGPTEGLDDTTLTVEKSIQSTLLKVIRNFV